MFLGQREKLEQKNIQRNSSSQFAEFHELYQYMQKLTETQAKMKKKILRKKLAN